jgi:hypothetical protein
MDGSVFEHIQEMKVNMFGGVFVFEGTVSEYMKILGNVDKLGNKLVGIQSKLNKDTLETQAALTKTNPELARNTPRPAGLQ